MQYWFCIVQLLKDHNNCGSLCICKNIISLWFSSRHKPRSNHEAWRKSSLKPFGQINWKLFGIFLEAKWQLSNTGSTHWASSFLRSREEAFWKKILFWGIFANMLFHPLHILSCSLIKWWIFEICSFKLWLYAIF